MALPEAFDQLELASKGRLSFETVFKNHFKNLHIYAIALVKDETDAEEIVQQVFYRLWEKKAHLQIQTSVTAYLYKAVYNASLNFLKHQKVKTNYQLYAVKNSQSTPTPAAEKIQLTELQNSLSKALNDLPPQCGLIFRMSRYDDLKYQQIATKLGLSVKTVENQMGKALKILREKLVDFLPLIIIILLNF
jgi:RNA polymerase sigma-70 factor, ECF subfamily